MLVAKKYKAPLVVTVVIAIAALGVGIAENIGRKPLSFDHPEDQPPTTAGEAIQRRVDGC